MDLCRQLQRHHVMLKRILQFPSLIQEKSQVLRVFELVFQSLVAGDKRRFCKAAFHPVDQLGTGKSSVCSYSDSQGEPAEQIAYLVIIAEVLCCPVVSLANVFDCVTYPG